MSIPPRPRPISAKPGRKAAMLSEARTNTSRSTIPARVTTKPATINLFCGYLLARRSAAREEKRMPSVAAVKITPVLIALYPRTSWRKTETTNDVPISTSHWMFCVTSARLQVRFLNNRVESSAGLWARSRERMYKKNHARNRAPIPRNRASSALLLPAWRIPNTTQNIPTPDRIAPTVSKGRVGSGARGSTRRRLRRTIVPTTRAWKTNAARQLIPVVITPPIKGPAAAPIPPSPLITPKAQAREVMSLNHKVARMYTGGISSAVPTPSKTELPRINTPRFGDTALRSAPTAYNVRPQVKHRLRPQRSVSLLHGIIRIAMIRRNSVIAVCTPLTVVSRSSLMSLIITFMFDPAKLQMNCASASGRISLRADASGRPGTAAAAGTRSSVIALSRRDRGGAAEPARGHAIAVLRLSSGQVANIA